jgi:hypothetical protein
MALSILSLKQSMHLVKQTPEVENEIALIKYYKAKRSDPRLIYSIEADLDSDLVIADLKQEIQFSSVKCRSECNN